MTHTPTPNFVQSLIVLSNSRKELLAAAIKNARKALELTAQTEWQPYADTAAEQQAATVVERY